jgi:hypothetical protein
MALREPSGNHLFMADTVLCAKASAFERALLATRNSRFGSSVAAANIDFMKCVGKKKHLARRLIATHQSTPCAPLSDVV